MYRGEKVRRLFLFLLLLLFLTGCDFNNDDYTFSEISFEILNDDTVKDFFMGIENNEDKDGKGVFTYKVSKDKFYLYLSPKYIAKNGKNFTIDLKTEKDSFDIYITDILPKEDNIREYGLYEVNVEKEYEYLRIFKSHTQRIGS